MLYEAVLALTLSLFLFSVCVLVYRQQKSWLAPGVFFLVIWFINFFLSSFVFRKNELNSLGLLWILISCLSFFNGSFIVGLVSPFSILSKKAKLAEIVQDDAIEKSFVLLNFAISLGFLSFILLVYLNHLNFSNLFRNFGEISRGFRSLSYGRETSLREFSIVKFLRIFIYFGNLLGGFLFPISLTRKDRFFSLLSLIPSFLLSSIFLARTGILMSLILWLTGYICSRILFFNEKGIAFLIKPLVFFILIVIGLHGFISYFRYDRIRLHMLNELFASLPAFSSWFNKNCVENYTIRLRYGAITFYSIAKNLGIRAGGGRLGVEYYGTNYGTIFSELIRDFGMPGSLLWLFLMGGFFSFVFAKVESGRIKYLPLMSFFYAYTLSSSQMTPFDYSSVTLAFLFFYFYFLSYVLPKVKPVKYSL